MRALLIILSFVFTTQGLCKDAVKGDKWKANRDQHVAKANERKAMIQKNIDCMTAATTREAYKVCRETMRKNREAFKAKHPAKKKN